MHSCFQVPGHIVSHATSLILIIHVLPVTILLEIKENQIALWTDFLNFGPFLPKVGHWSRSMPQGQLHIEEVRPIKQIWKRALES